jgi:hypothetical protein
MTSLSVISALEVGGSVEMYDEHLQRVFHEPDGGKMAPSKLPYDSISTIFENIGDFYLEITAVIVVCRGFLVLWRHGGRRQEGKVNEATQILNHVIMVMVAVPGGCQWERPSL